MQFITRGRDASTGHYQDGRDRERATSVSSNSIGRGPLFLMSLGTLLVIFWLVLLLPGQDIVEWQQEQQLLLAANNFNQDICLPRLSADPIYRTP